MRPIYGLPKLAQSLEILLSYDPAEMDGESLAAALADIKGQIEECVGLKMAWALELEAQADKRRAVIVSQQATLKGEEAAIKSIRSNVLNILEAAGIKYVMTDLGKVRSQNNSSAALVKPEEYNVLDLPEEFVTYPPPPEPIANEALIKEKVQEWQDICAQLPKDHPKPPHPCPGWSVVRGKHIRVSP